MINIIFEDVLVHLFKNILPGNIILDIEKVDINNIIKNNKRIFINNKKYGWPPIKYSNIKELIEIIKNNNYNGYELISSYGCSGWILSKSIKTNEEYKKN